MSEYIINITEEETIQCHVCNEVFNTKEITTDDYYFDRYKMRSRGQYLIDSEKANWKHYSHGQPMDKSKCIRIYIDDTIQKEREYNYYLTRSINFHKVRRIIEISKEVLDEC